MSKLENLQYLTRYLHWLARDTREAHDMINGALINPKGQLVTVHSGLSERNLMMHVDEILKDIKDYTQSLEHYRRELQEQCDTWEKTPEVVWEVA